MRPSFAAWNIKIDTHIYNSFQPVRNFVTCSGGLRCTRRKNSKPIDDFTSGSFFSNCRCRLAGWTFIPAPHEKFSTRGKILSHLPLTWVLPYDRKACWEVVFHDHLKTFTWLFHRGNPSETSRNTRFSFSYIRRSKQKAIGTSVLRRRKISLYDWESIKHSQQMHSSVVLFLVLEFMLI